VTLPGLKHLIINKPPDVINGNQGIKISRKHKNPRKVQSQKLAGTTTTSGKKKITVTTVTELGGKRRANDCRDETLMRRTDIETPDVPDAGPLAPSKTAQRHSRTHELT